MARTLDISEEESIQQNLNEWCYEVGTHYEEFSRKAAAKFIKYIGKKPVVDLGSGDGAGAKVFISNGNPTTAVDINPEKLSKIEATKVNTDFLSFLTKPVDNIFCHHALEHFVNYQEVLDRIGKHLKKGCYAYIAVPKGDDPHSVHHVAFESCGELIPPNTELIEYGESDDSAWPEFYVVVRK